MNILQELNQILVYVILPIKGNLEDFILFLNAIFIGHLRDIKTFALTYLPIITDFFIAFVYPLVPNGTQRYY